MAEIKLDFILERWTRSIIIKQKKKKGPDLTLFITERARASRLQGVTLSVNLGVEQIRCLLPLKQNMQIRLQNKMC